MKIYNARIFAMSSAFALALAGGAAHAVGLADNYAQGYYIDTDQFDDGFGLAASFMATPEARLFAEFNSLDNIDTFRLGAGWVIPLDEQVGFEAGASYLDSDFDDGFGVHGTARFNATPEFNLAGRLEYQDVGDDDDIAFSVAADFRFIPEASAFAQFETFDDGDNDTVKVGARYFF